MVVWKVCQEKAFSLYVNMETQLRLAKSNLNKQNDNWTDKTTWWPGLLAVTESTINSYTEVFWSKMWGCLSDSWGLGDTGSWNRTMISSIAVPLQPKGWKICKTRPTQVQTSTALQCWGRILRELCINEPMQTSVNWCKMICLILQRRERLIKSFRKQLLQL